MYHVMKPNQTNNSFKLIGLYIVIEATDVVEYKLRSGGWCLGSLPKKTRKLYKQLNFRHYFDPC